MVAAVSISVPPDVVTSPRGPRAPTQAEWDAMTDDERRRAVETLPCYIPPEESGAMEGDRHTACAAGAVGALRAYYEATGRDVYVSGEMAVYFPGQHRVAPDVYAVMGATPGPRDSWVVTKEGRRPAWALEIIVLGDRRKDLKAHVVEYAALGIREYFVADIPRRRLLGYRLADEAIGIYTQLVPQSGRYRSEVLGLDLALEGERVRFYHGSAKLLEPEEIAAQLEDRLNDEQVQRREAEERAASAEERAASAEERAAAEAASRANLETEMARLRDELERLRRG